MLKPKPEVKPRLKLPSFLDEVLRTILFVIVVTVLFDMAIPRSLVDGRSMAPTFEDRERLIVSRIDYLAIEPRRGDVVVFNSLEDPNNEEMLIKRVIGLPGDIVEFRNQAVFVNGKPLNEPYIAEACTRNCADETWQIKEDEYFVMGDNRNHSRDSRSFGVVPIDHIVGHVVFRYWPLPRIGLIGSRSYDN